MSAAAWTAGSFRKPRRTWWWVAGLTAVFGLTVVAHDLYTAYVQHRVHLTAGATHIDVNLDLTFFEEWSWRERRRMDADQDGRISRSELDEYIKKNAPDWNKQVRLLAAGHELPLVELFEPEVDLLGTDRAAPAHHRLRLSFFASTPPGLRPGDPLVVESSLWSEAKGLVSVQAVGQDGCKLEAEKRDQPTVPPARPGEHRQFTIRCLHPPSPAAPPP
jgi:hypothetical protein